MGLAWSLLAVGVLAYLLWFHEPQQHSEPVSPEWIKEQREFLDAYSLQDGVIQKQSGLLIKHITQGTGATPTAQSFITAHYIGKLVDGRIFDSSIDEGQPIRFQLSGVIPGWREAFQFIQVGGKAEVVIPAALAYGASSPDTRFIPNNSALIFEVELLDVQ
jgi:FKBP-type peptidyl-prolyl cis-trans isomerase